MPERSQGQAFGALLQWEGIQLIPSPVGLDSQDGDDQSLQLRLPACLDLWHRVTGCPSTLLGEAAIGAFMTQQLRQTGPALLIAANVLSRGHGDHTGPALAEAISCGLRLGGVCDRLMAHWRCDLGSAEELAFSPFAAG